MQVCVLDLLLTQPEGRFVTATLDYWKSRQGKYRMPARGDLDPLDIPSLLSHVYLVDVAHDPLDFRYRLLGTEIVKRSRSDYTGQGLTELPEQKPASQIWTLYRKAVVETVPVTALIPYLHIPGRFVEILAAPLSDDGRIVNMLLGAIDFPRDPQRQTTSTVF